MPKDSAARTILVAVLLCIVCSVLVTAAAVILREKQEKNKQLDVKKNLLLASGLLKNSKASEQEILDAYASVEAEIIDLETGELYTKIKFSDFDQRKLAKDPKTNRKIPQNIDKVGWA